MKRMHVVVVLAAALLAMLFVPLASARTNSGTLELNAGYSKSSNDMTGNDETLGGGINFGASYWRSVSPLVSWGAEASYDNLGNIEYDNGNTTDNTISSTVFRVNPAMRVNFSPRAQGAQFFAQAGAGLYNVGVDIEDSIVGNADDSESKLGVNVGLGVSFPAGTGGRMNFGGMYHSVNVNDLSVNYWQFRAGYGFRI